MTNKQLCVAMAAFVILLISGVSYSAYLAHQQESTKQLLFSESTRLLVEGESLQPAKDCWGNDLLYHLEASTDTSVVVRIATVISCGPDGIAKTPDDMATSKQDINKTRLVGKWIGKRTKEGLKGFWQGLTEK